MTLAERTLLGIAALLIVAASSTASASTKVALLFGNSNYAHAPSLSNPVNDAHDLSVQLEELGFEVEIALDADFSAMRKTLRSFQRRALGAEVALIYFAGHGIEIDRSNYLLPVDAELQRDVDVSFEAISLDTILVSAEGARTLSLVILDACRDNPFLDRIAQTSPTRSIGRGLSVVDPTRNTLVAYSAKAGTIAFDGEGRNSPYAGALLSALQEPGLEISLLFRTVRDTVVRQTNGLQEPFLYGSLSAEEIFLNKMPDATSEPVMERKEPAEVDPYASLTAPRSTTSAPDEAEIVFWTTVASSTNPTDFEAYLAAFPNGTFAVLAENRLAMLSRAGDLLETSSVSETGLTDSSKVRPRGSIGDSAASATSERSREEDLRPLERNEIRELQERLAVMGFAPGRPDGVYGRRTESAIMGFERQHDVTVRGQATREILRLARNEVSEVELSAWRAAQRRSEQTASPNVPRRRSAAQTAAAEPTADVASNRNQSQFCLSNRQCFTKDCLGSQPWGACQFCAHVRTVCQ